MEIVRDLKGRSGEVLTKNGRFILVRWTYGTYCISESIAINSDGERDYRVHQRGLARRPSKEKNP